MIISDEPNPMSSTGQGGQFHTDIATFLDIRLEQSTVHFPTIFGDPWNLPRRMLNLAVIRDNVAVGEPSTNRPANLLFFLPSYARVGTCRLRLVRQYSWGFNWDGGVSDIPVRDITATCTYQPIVRNWSFEGGSHAYNGLSIVPDNIAGINARRRTSAGMLWFPDAQLGGNFFPIPGAGTFAQPTWSFTFPLAAEMEGHYHMYEMDISNLAINQPSETVTIDEGSLFHGASGIGTEERGLKILVNGVVLDVNNTLRDSTIDIPLDRLRIGEMNEIQVHLRRRNVAFPGLPFNYKSSPLVIPFAQGTGDNSSQYRVSNWGFTERGTPNTPLPSPWLPWQMLNMSESAWRNIAIPFPDNLMPPSQIHREQVQMSLQVYGEYVR
jgi:hypothetical protein